LRRCNRRLSYGCSTRRRRLPGRQTCSRVSRRNRRSVWSSNGRRVTWKRCLRARRLPIWAAIPVTALPWTAVQGCTGLDWRRRLPSIAG
jgi:hypothetical protein